MNRPNLDMIALVAQALGELCDRVVFVGGAVVDLYVTTSSAPPARPTFDVDCIVHVMSRVEYANLEVLLRSKGFRNDQRPSAPTCRWRIGEVSVDIMPTSPDILGFVNEWHASGIANAVTVQVDPRCSIRILPPPNFLASKMLALHDRGIGDLRTSADFEDIVHLLRNREAVVREILDAAPPVRGYLQHAFHDILQFSGLNEAIVAVLDRGEPPGTAARIRSTMESLQ